MRHRAFVARLTGAVALTLAMVCTVGPAEGASPTITDLGTLTGGFFSTSSDISAPGLIVGTSDSDAGFRAYLWNGALVSLGTLPNGGESFGYGVNPAGRVVGQARNATGQFRAVVWDTPDNPQEVGTLPGHARGVARAINAAGDVVGDSSPLMGLARAFRWRAATGIIDLGLLAGGTFSAAMDINDAGQVTGEANATGAAFRAFVWDELSGMVNLGVLPGGSYTRARRINNQGQIVGWGDLGSGDLRGFVWNPATGFTVLPTLGGTMSFATAINNQGQVVGSSTTATGASHAFVWDPVNGMVDLGTLPGGSTSAAYGINDAGQVAGEGDVDTGETHAVRWQLNRAPVAQGSTVSTEQDTAVPVTLGGSDPDGDPVVFNVVTGPANGSLSGAAPSLVYTPAPGFSGNDSFSFTVGDGLASSTTATVNVVVTPVAPPDGELDGRMAGQGRLEDQKHFAFRVGRDRKGNPRGHLVFWSWQQKGHGWHKRWQLEHFKATSVTSVAFLDAPNVKPSKLAIPVVDTATFGGLGCWNGQKGYRFEVQAVDAGEPGRGRDTFAIVIRGPKGEEVASAKGTLVGGNIQSKKVHPPAPIVVAGVKKK